MVIGLVKLKRVKTMVGKYWVKIKKIILELKLGLNGSQVLLRQFNIGYLPSLLVLSLFTKGMSLKNGMGMH